MRVNVRRANSPDLDILTAFTLGEAKDAEGIQGNEKNIHEGIKAALEDELLAYYWVLESEGDGVIGSVSVVKEWSDWNAGFYWWIQSIYIKPQFRGRGLMDKLIQAVNDEAKREQALDIRLYVHKKNQRAINAYKKSGFLSTDYSIMRKEINR